MLNQVTEKHHLFKETTNADVGVGRGGSEGALAPPEFENFSKKGCFLSFKREKSNFTLFGPPLETFWKNPLVLPP